MKMQVVCCCRCYFLSGVEVEEVVVIVLSYESFLQGQDAERLVQVSVNK